MQTKNVRNKMNRPSVVVQLVVCMSVCGLWSVSQALKCGIAHTPSTSTRIVGGTPIRAHQYPWLVHLETRHVPVPLPSGAYQYYQTLCAGSLIDAQWLLTTAACVPLNSPYTGFKVNGTIVHLGVHNVTDQTESRLVVTAARVYHHEHYNESLGQVSPQNIALVKLPSVLNFEPIADRIAPICLPLEGDTISRTECQTVGWGTTSTAAGSKTSDVAHVATVVVPPRHTCAQHWPNYLDDHKLCAGDASGTVCASDSGAPLQCRNEDGQWTLEGLAHFGDAQCKVEALFEKVAAYLHWIHQVRQNDF